MVSHTPGVEMACKSTTIYRSLKRTPIKNCQHQENIPRVPLACSVEQSLIIWCTFTKIARHPKLLSIEGNGLNFNLRLGKTSSSC